MTAYKRKVNNEDNMNILTEFGEVMDLIIPDKMPKQLKSNDNRPPAIYVKPHTECDVCYAPMNGLDPVWRHCCSGSCAKEAYL